jgi:hypothetical protein
MSPLAVFTEPLSPPILPQVVSQGRPRYRLLRASYPAEIVSRFHESGRRLDGFRFSEEKRARLQRSVPPRVATGVLPSVVIGRFKLRRVYRSEVEAKTQSRSRCEEVNSSWSDPNGSDCSLFGSVHRAAPLDHRGALNGGVRGDDRRSRGCTDGCAKGRTPLEQSGYMSDDFAHITTSRTYPIADQGHAFLKRGGVSPHSVRFRRGSTPWRRDQVCALEHFGF